MFNTVLIAFLLLVQKHDMVACCVYETIAFCVGFFFQFFAGILFSLIRN